MSDMKTVVYSMIGGMVVGLTTAYLAMPKHVKGEINHAVMHMMEKKSDMMFNPNCQKNN